jgi:hypothetical protein
MGGQLLGSAPRGADRQLLAEGGGYQREKKPQDRPSLSRGAQSELPQ